ncbi:Uncharacterised protein [Candidatus Anstonella stagnisolia]|nr:Uncharacterised protein [Candidatus Anstonella stagnisolia]
MAAKNKAASPAFQKEKISQDEFYMQSSYGLLVGMLGVVWLAQEIGWLDTNLPLGPLAIILLGLLIMFSRIRKNQ